MYRLDCYTLRLLLQIFVLALEKKSRKKRKKKIFLKIFIFGLDFKMVKNLAGEQNISLKH